MSLERATRGALLTAALLTAALLGGCERRVSEPLAPNGSTAQRTTVAASSTAVDAGRLAGRCVRPTPAAPSRPRPPPGPDPACPPDPAQPFALRHARVIFERAGGVAEVEVAEQQPARTRGLMYRRQLAEEQGMLFVFARRRVQRFWMKNTCLPLDMLFIDRDGLIVGIEENVPTLNEHGYQVGCPSTFVLEMGAGWARRHGVRAGQQVRFEGL